MQQFLEFVLINSQQKSSPAISEGLLVQLVLLHFTSQIQ